MSCLRKWGVLKRKGWGLKRQSMENESEENEVGVYSGACGNKVLREWKACIYRKGKGRCGSGFRLSFGVFTTARQAGKRKDEAESGTNTVAPSLLLCPSQGVQTWLHTRLGGWSRVRNRAGSQSGWGERRPSLRTFLALLGEGLLQVSLMKQLSETILAFAYFFGMGLNAYTLLGVN